MLKNFWALSWRWKVIKWNILGAYVQSHHPYNQVSMMCPQPCLLLMTQSDEMRWEVFAFQHSLICMSDIYIKLSCPVVGLGPSVNYLPGGPGQSKKPFRFLLFLRAFPLFLIFSLVSLIFPSFPRFFCIVFAVRGALCPHLDISKSNDNT